MSTPVPTPGLEQLHCVACGEEFGCGANANPRGATLNCWCSAIEVREAALTEMKARYQGCLCRNCLTKLSDGERA